MLLEGDFGEMPPKVREYVKKSFDISTEMNLNIETFLNLNKLETGELKLTKGSFDMQDEITRIIADFKGKTEEKKIGVEFIRNEYIPDVFADRFLICHVIANLISNAVKYTPDGGRVKISLVTGKDGVIFMVEDTGIGIDPAEMSSLFKKYERGRETAKAFDGTGVGLFLSKKLVELHGGRIWAESEGKGKGTRFLFTIPI